MQTRRGLLNMPVKPWVIATPYLLAIGATCIAATAYYQSRGLETVIGAIAAVAGALIFAFFLSFILTRPALPWWHVGSTKADERALLPWLQGAAIACGLVGCVITSQIAPAFIAWAAYQSAKETLRQNAGLLVSKAFG